MDSGSKQWLTCDGNLYFFVMTIRNITNTLYKYEQRSVYSPHLVHKEVFIAHHEMEAIRPIIFPIPLTACCNEACKEPAIISQGIYTMGSMTHINDYCA